MTPLAADKIPALQRWSTIFAIIGSVAFYLHYGELYPLPFGPGFPGKIISSRHGEIVTHRPIVRFYAANRTFINEAAPWSLFSQEWGTIQLYLRYFPIPREGAIREHPWFPWKDQAAWGSQMHTMRPSPSSTELSEGQRVFGAAICRRYAPAGTHSIGVTWRTNIETKISAETEWSYSCAVATTGAFK